MASAQRGRLCEPGALRSWQRRGVTHAGVSPSLQQPKPRRGSLTPVIQRRKATGSTASRGKVSTAPEGDASRALPALANLSRGFPTSQTHSPRAGVAAVRGRGSAPLGKRRDATARRGERGAGWGQSRYSQLGLQARCELLRRAAHREALGEQGRGAGTTAGLQPQTVSKWVSIC